MTVITDLNVTFEDDPTPTMGICNGVAPYLSSPRALCREPDYATWMYPVSCPDAGCLFPFQMWLDGKAALERFLKNVPTPDHSSTAKRLWAEWVGEYIGRMVWATNVRLRSYTQANSYLVSLDAHMGADRKQRLGWRLQDYQDKLRLISEPLTQSQAWFTSAQDQAFAQYPSEKNYANQGLVTATQHFDWGTDPAATSSFYAQPGTFVSIIIEDTHKARNLSGGASKVRRFLKKLSPIQPAQPGRAPRYERHFVLSADSTIRYLQIMATELVSTTYADMIAAGMLRWYVCLEAAYDAGLIDPCGGDPACDPAEAMRALADEVRRIQGAANQATMDDAARLAAIIPYVGVYVAAVLKVLGRIGNKFAASGVYGVDCVPPPFLRSSDRTDCDVTTGAGPGVTTAVKTAFEATGVRPPAPPPEEAPPPPPPSPEEEPPPPAEGGVSPVVVVGGLAVAALGVWALVRWRG